MFVYNGNTITRNLVRGYIITHEKAFVNPFLKIEVKNENNPSL